MFFKEMKGRREKKERKETAGIGLLHDASGARGKREAAFVHAKRATPALWTPNSRDAVTLRGDRGKCDVVTLRGDRGN